MHKNCLFPLRLYVCTGIQVFSTNYMGWLNEQCESPNMTDKNEIQNVDDEFWLVFSDYQCWTCDNLEIIRKSDELTNWLIVQLLMTICPLTWLCIFIFLPMKLVQATISSVNSHEISHSLLWKWRGSSQSRFCSDHALDSFWLDLPPLQVAQ